MKIRFSYSHRHCTIDAEVDSPEEGLRVLNSFPPEEPSYLCNTLASVPVATRATEADPVQRATNAAIETATQPENSKPTKTTTPKAAKEKAPKAAPAPAPAQAGEPEKVTREDVTAAMMALCDRTSVADAKALLSEFGVERAGGLTPDQYGPFVAAADARGI